MHSRWLMAEEELGPKVSLAHSFQPVEEARSINDRPQVLGHRSVHDCQTPRRSHLCRLAHRGGSRAAAVLRLTVM